jgi:hypothetical protein
MSRRNLQGGMATVMSLALIAGAALFVWVTSQALPAVVASRFSASGAADGFMPSGIYVSLMLGLVVVVPALLVFLPNVVFRNPGVRINVPHREYWLAPERHAGTIDYLCRHSARMGVWLLVFLSYVHWLVVRANAVSPPNLSSSWFIAGLLAFTVFAVAWSWALFVRFRNVPH